MSEPMALMNWKISGDSRQPLSFETVCTPSLAPSVDVFREDANNAEEVAGSGLTGETPEEGGDASDGDEDEGEDEEGDAA